MSTEVALLAVQLRTALLPVAMLLGFALNAIVGTLPAGFCGVPIDPPPHAMVAIRLPNKNMNAGMRRTDRIEKPLLLKVVRRSD
jgi:hypothetical protein